MGIVIDVIENGRIVSSRKIPKGDELVVGDRDRVSVVHTRGFQHYFGTQVTEINVNPHGMEVEVSLVTIVGRRKDAMGFVEGAKQVTEGKPLEAPGIYRRRPVVIRARKGEEMMHGEVVEVGLTLGESGLYEPKVNLKRLLKRKPSRPRTTPAEPERAAVNP